MDLIVEDLASGITVAHLTGRMDIEGAAAVDLKLNALAGSKPALILDLSNVTFMASMGLRTLMLCGKAMGRARRKMAIAAPQANVDTVLRSSGVDEVVPIFATLDEAKAAVAG